LASVVAVPTCSSSIPHQISISAPASGAPTATTPVRVTPFSGGGLPPPQADNRDRAATRAAGRAYFMGTAPRDPAGGPPRRADARERAYEGARPGRRSAGLIDQAPRGVTKRPRDAAF